MTIIAKATTAVTTIALAGALSFGAVAQDSQKEERLKEIDPLAQAQQRCEALRREAENGTVEQKELAEEKCQKAIAWAKEKMAKDPKPE